jgi:hypothetical protein
MPKEIAKNKDGDSIMFHGWMSGLFDGKLLSIKKKSPRGPHRDGGRHHEARSDGHTHNQHQSSAYDDRTRRDHSHHHGYHGSYLPNAQSNQPAPSFNPPPPASIPADGYYRNEPIRPPVVHNPQVGRNYATQAAVAPVGWYGQNVRTNYLQNNYYNGYDPAGGVAGYEQSGGNPQADDDVPHDSRTCEEHTECLRAQVEELRMAQRTRPESPVRSVRAAYPASRNSRHGECSRSDK